MVQIYAYSSTTTTSIYSSRYVYCAIFVFDRFCSSHQLLHSLTKYVPGMYVVTWIQHNNNNNAHTYLCYRWTWFVSTIFLYFFVPCFLPGTRYRKCRTQQPWKISSGGKQIKQQKKIYTWNTHLVPITCVACFRFLFLASHPVPGMKNTAQWNIVPRASDGDWDWIALKILPSFGKSRDWIDGFGGRSFQSRTRERFLWNWVLVLHYSCIINEARPRERSDRGHFLPSGKKASL